MFKFITHPQTKLSEIKKRYEFNDDANFEEMIIELLSWSDIWREEYKLSPRPKDKKHFYSRISKLITGILQQSESLLKEISDGEHILSNDLIAHHKTPSLSKPDLNNLEITSLESDIESQIHTLKHRLEPLLTASEIFLPPTQNNQGGRPVNPYHKRCLYYLVNFYAKYTGKKPKASRDGAKENYTGEVILFLLDMKKVLKQKEIGFTLTANNTIGHTPNN